MKQGENNETEANVFQFPTFTVQLVVLRNGNRWNASQQEVWTTIEVSLDYVRSD
jgi:hypothetical protein